MHSLSGIFGVRHFDVTITVLFAPAAPSRVIRISSRRRVDYFRSTKCTSSGKPIRSIRLAIARRLTLLKKGRLSVCDFLFRLRMMPNTTV